MRDAVLEPRLDAQTLPAASTATPVGSMPTGMMATRVPLFRRRDTDALPGLAIQTSPSWVTATPRVLKPPVGNVPRIAPAGLIFLTVWKTQFAGQMLPSGSIPMP